MGNLHFSVLLCPTEALSVRFSSVPGPTGSSGAHEGRFSRDPLPVFSAGDPCEQFWHGQGCSLFDVVYPALPVPTAASLTLQGAVGDGFGETVVACDMPELCNPMQILESHSLVKSCARDDRMSSSLPRTLCAHVAHGLTHTFHSCLNFCVCVCVCVCVCACACVRVRECTIYLSLRRWIIIWI